MRKVILNMNMTCDGFFNLDWMGESPQIQDQELIDDTTAQISGAGNASKGEAGGAFVGYSFYRGMVQFWSSLENNPQATEREHALAQAVNNSRRIVISRREEKLEGKNSELLVVKNDQELLEAVTRLKQQEGSNLAVIGGVRTAQTFVRLGLIDEYVLLVHPVAIGNGQRVFTGRINLELISTKTYKSGVMRVCYRSV
jgi:dihydrofolate reductase